MPSSPFISVARQHQRGLSYLEVLIAASIGLVGMLGAIALFPVATLQMQRGLEADAANTIGEAAVHQAVTLGLGNAKTWMFNGAGALPAATDWVPVEHTIPNNSDPRYAHANDPAPDQNRFQEYGNRSWHKGIRRNSSFCIDPRMIAEMTFQNGGGSATAVQTNNQNYWFFPYVPKSNAAEDDIFMFRVSLQNPLTNGPLSVQQSRLLFKSADDLIFNREKSDSFGRLPAEQVFMSNNAGLPQRRDYMAEYEWIATLVPKFNGSPIANGAQSQIVQSGEYVLSIVVFHNRRTRMDAILINQTTSENFIEDERAVDVIQFLGNGVGGGDVLIRSKPRQIGAGPTVFRDSDTYVRENDWVMLGRMVKNFDAAGNPIVDTNGLPVITGPIFQWYRVTGVQGEATALDPTGVPILVGNTNTTNAYFRYLTLQGGDWSVADANDPNIAVNAGQNNPNAKSPLAKMTIVSGVVGVFERTIRLE